MAKTVTGIVPKGKKRFKVYLDGQYAFSLSRPLVREISLEEQLDDARIEELTALDRQETAYRQAHRLLAVRPRSERELRIRFDRQGVDQPDQEAVLNRLKIEGLLDDAAFARAWIDNRMEFRPRGAWALRSELRGKGVANEVIDQTLEDFNEEEAARRAARAGTRRYKHLSPELFSQRLSAYLSRRGFQYHLISPLVAKHAAGVERESEGRS